MHELFFLSLMGIVLALPPGRPPDENAKDGPHVAFWTQHALLKVRPNDPPEKSTSAELYAARNEFESFQIVIRAASSDLENVDVEITDFSSTAGARIRSDQAVVYLESFLNLIHPSSLEGGTGEWPDPLLPRVDRYTHERRNAFPFKVPRGRNQPIWVELYIPADTPSGKYAGSAIISVNGIARETVAIILNVWGFALPSTSSFTTTFGFSGVSALAQHRVASAGDPYLLTYLYTKAALLHRISTHGGTMAAPPFSHAGDKIELDWRAYDQEVGPFLDGAVFSREDPLYGANSTSVELRLHPALDTDEKKLGYMREWVSHFKKRGWFDRLFFYPRDEPAAVDYPGLIALGKLAHQADPELRTIVTAPLDPLLSEVIGIWVPLVNCFERKPGFANFCARTVPRDAYDDKSRAGRGLWWYQSCASHGCNVVGGDYFKGWPSYVIDTPAVGNRIMPWLAWKYRIGGELYYSMDEAFQPPMDPWTDVYMHGGNGDGTLFYPGRPDQIGGRSPIPIESIRLKLVRDGLEDYEYMALLSRLGESDFAGERVKRLVEKAYLWQHESELLYGIRREMGEELNRILTAPPRLTSPQRMENR